MNKFYLKPFWSEEWKECDEETYKRVLRHYKGTKYVGIDFQTEHVCGKMVAEFHYGIK